MTQNNLKWLSVTILLCAFALPLVNVASAQVPQGFFTDVTPVLVDPAFSDFIPAVSPDGRTLYFTSFNRSDPVGNEDIFVATRPDTASAFGDIQPLGSPVNTLENEDIGYISTDEKTIYFGSARPGGEGFDLYQATRDNIGDPFENVTNLGPGVNTAFGENSPRLTPDEKTIVFHRNENDTGVSQRDIWLATRASTTVPFGDATKVFATKYQDRWPSISADKLTLFFSDWVQEPPRPGGVEDSIDIWVSTRSSETDAFGPAVNLNDLWPGTEVNTEFIDGVPYISPDWPAIGSKLYFVSNSTTGELVADVFQATWVPEPSMMWMAFVGLIGLGKFRK